MGGLESAWRVVQPALHAQSVLAAVLAAEGEAVHIRASTRRGDQVSVVLESVTVLRAFSR